MQGRQLHQNSETALDVLADASMLGASSTTQQSNTNTDYGCAVWPGNEQESRNIAELELEGELLRRALQEQHQQQQLQQHGGNHVGLEHYDSTLTTTFDSHLAAAQNPYDAPNAYQPLISPTHSTTSTPYFPLSSASASYANPFDLQATAAHPSTYNQNYFDPNLSFQNAPRASQSPTANPVDEDKRQRNSAASARFRAKRKQREEALQAESRQKRESLQELETRARSLEAENKFLRRLLVEKEGGGDREDEGDGEQSTDKGKGKAKA